MFSGSRLHFHRQRAGKTQEWLAREIGITSAYLCNIENGKRIPSPKVMDALANALSVRIEELLDGGDLLPPVPISAAEKGIVVETGEGANKVRYVLPPTPEAYELVSKHICNHEDMSDARLRMILDSWRGATEAEKVRIAGLLDTDKDERPA
jgi:transcriptional regulator with XRE-family HTH domain